MNIKKSLNLLCVKDQIGIKGSNVWDKMMNITIVDNSELWYMVRDSKYRFANINEVRIYNSIIWIIDVK